MQLSCRRGFNLIEAAIVLGVVGLVIGGIWIAAASVTENRKATTMASDFTFIVSQFKNLYKGFPAPGLAATDTVSTLFAAGAFPKGYTLTGGGSQVTTSSDSSVSMWVTGTQINYMGLTKKSCISIVQAAQRDMSGLDELFFDCCGAIPSSSLPLSPADVISNCEQSDYGSGVTMGVKIFLN
jgi:hypothetical protein